MAPSSCTEDAAAVRRHPLVTEVARTLARRCGVAPHAPVVLGVSGGADSLALLVAARCLRDRRPPALEPVVVHVNHHLRPDADEDAAFVAGLGRRLGVPVEVHDVRPDASAHGGLQADARRLRYDALARAAAGAGARHIAVAHHADDQLETMLMALGRGAGLEGLAGMRWAHPIGEGLSLVRPLLAVPRRLCEDLCRAAGLPWRDDPGNRDPGGLRARLRRDVVPVLETLWPGAAVRSAGLADLLDAAAALLERELERLFGPPAKRVWSREAIASLPGPFIAAGLRRAAVALRPECADELGQVHLLAAADAVRDGVRQPRRFDWPRGLALQVTAHGVALAIRSCPPR